MKDKIESKTEFIVHFVGYVDIQKLEKESLEKYLPNVTWKDFTPHGDCFIPNDSKQELSIKDLVNISKVNGVDSVIISGNTLWIEFK